jgi:transporter family-2 protein
VPQLGAVSTVAALIFGQVITAMLLDATGAFGLPLHEISWQRIGAALLIFSGLVLSRL